MVNTYVAKYKLSWWRSWNNIVRLSMKSLSVISMWSRNDDAQGPKDREAPLHWRELVTAENLMSILMTFKINVNIREVCTLVSSWTRGLRLFVTCSKVECDDASLTLHNDRTCAFRSYSILVTHWRDSMITYLQ